MANHLVGGTFSTNEECEAISNNKAQNLDNAADSMRDIIHNLRSLRDRINPKPQDETKNGINPKGVPSLADVLNHTPDKLRETRTICIDLINEIADILGV